MAELYEEFLADAAAAHKPRVVEKLENISNKSGSLLENLSAFSYDDSAARERTRQGLYSQTSLDADINYQTEQAKQLQFGVEGAQSIAEKMREARSNLDQKYRSNRTGGEAVKDSLLGITQGITNTIGGGVAFTAGLPSETVGLGISSAVDSVDSFLERNKSQYLRDQGDIYTAKQGLSAQDNKILSTEQGYEPDSFRESADRVIRDAVSAISNTTDSGALTANVASQGVGSLVGGVAVAKAIGASAIPIIGGKAAQVIANSKGKIEDALSVVGKATRASNNRAMITSIGVSEGGSAYNQLTAQIMSKTHEELYGTSPYYTKLFDMTGDHEEAKRQTAHAAGRKLALQVAPAAAAVAPLVSKFESTPFSGMLNKGLTNTGSQAGKEMIEEGYQGLAGKYLENRTTQEYIDPSKDVLEGLGEEVGQGMLGGVASVGAIRSPSIARAAVVGSVKTVGKGIGAVLGSSKESTKAKPLNPAVSKRALDDLAEAAPVVTQTFEDAVQSVPEEQKEATSSYLQNILDLGSFNEDTFSANKTLQTITLDSKNKFEAIEKLAQVAGDKEADQKTRLDAGLALMSIEADVNRVVDASPDIFAELPDDHPAAQMANAVMGAVGSAFSIPEVANVVATVNEILSQEGAVPKVDEASHLTPEGQEAIQTNIQVAQYAPNKGDIENTRTILAQDSRGDITLTENQRTALRISMALLTAEKNRDMSKSILGEGALDTGKEITFEGGSKGLSITEHAMGVMRALNNKDVDRAKESLEDLGMFAQHMSNKVAALNTNIEKVGVGRETYQSWNQKAKKWFESEEGLFLNTNSPTSIALAQEISHEAGLAIESYNNLIDATGLDLDKIPLVQVNSNSVKQTLSSEPDVAFPDLQIPVEAYEDGSIQFDEDVQDESEVVPTVTTQPTQKDVEDVTQKEKTTEPKQTKAKKTTEKKVIEPVGNVTFTSPKGVKLVYRVVGDKAYRVLKSGKEKPLVKTGAAYKKVIAEYQKDRVEDVEVPTVVAEVIPVVEEPVVTLEESNNQRQIDLVEQRLKDEEEALLELEENEPESTTDTITPIEKPTKELSGLGSIFSDLLFAAEKGKNVFLRTFKLPTEQRTNMFGEEAPLDRLREILGSGTSMAKFVGEKWRNKLDRTAQDAWEDYLNQGQELIYTVDDTVKAFLHNKRVNKKGVERESRMEYMARTGKDLNETEEGLLLNIMEEVTRTDEKGNEYASYALNKELAESATAAALNWLLNDAQNVTNYDAERVAKAMGISQMDVTPELIEYFNSGNMVTTSIEELGKKIQQYWGLSTEQNAYIGDQQGIVESLARELLSAMVKEGQLELSKGYELPILGGDTKYTPNKYVFVKTINNKEHSTALQKTASALEEIFLKDPEVSRYIGSDAKPTTATHQLRNPLAALTRQQRQALNTVQNSEYRIDPAMVGMYGMLGSKGMIELFNSDDQVDDNFNVNHQKSVIGQNKGIAGAFEDFATHLDEMQDIAEFENIPVSEVATRYKFEFSSVNRMQMQGKFTPQSSKYIREVMMTTWATLDLSDLTSQDSKNFYRGVAQALGIKIHKKDPSIWSSEYDKTVADLGLAIDMVGGLLRNVKEDNLLDQIPMESGDISKLKEYITKAGVDVSPLTLHAIVELARLRTSKDKSKFKTSLYLEADGMTNGPANAMMMLSGGIVSPEWVMNMERGGFYINQPDAFAGKKNSSGLLDMYEEAARILRDSIVNSGGNFTRNPNFVLYDLFTKDITLTDDDISIGRNLIKNPLTVTIYGSGLYGIAEKMTSTLIDSIYERMSEAQAAMSKDPNLSIELALFPDSAGDSQSAKLINAKRSYNDFLYSFGALTNLNMKGAVIDPRNFTIDLSSKALMVKSIQKSVAKPMQNAITEVVGEEVMNNAESMRKAAAAMSVYASAIQRNMMDKQVALNKQRVTGYKQRQLITQKQLREVEKESTRVAALFGSKTQNYFINGDGEYAPNINTSVGLDGTGAMSGHIKGFGNAGVKAVAYMNISIDGQMMQNAFTSDAEVRHNQLTTFDGMQSPLSAVEEVGQQMNQAVWDSWNDNSTLTLGNRLAEFIEIMDLDLLTPEDKLELSKVYAESPKKLTQPFDDAYLMSHIENNKKNLIDAGNEHAALMKVLGELNSTTDQMAGTDSALVRNRDNSTFTSTDPEEIAKYIQEEVRKVLGNKTNQSDVGTILSERIAKDVAKGKTPDGVYVITKQELSSLLGSSMITDDQKSIIREALNNKVLDDWKILVGNPKDIKNFVKDRAVGVDAFNTAMNKNYEGFTDPVNKLIVLLNGTGETLAHELTHASTYQKMVNFYSDPNSVTKEEAEAIQRTEALTDQFVSFDARTLDHLPGLQSTVSKVQDIIVSQLVQGNKADALNEFMAWTLSNPDLAEQAKRTKASKLGRLVKDAWEAIKAIFGSKYLPRVSDDVYSNLRFNSTVLSANPQSVTEFVNNSTILAHDNNADRGVDLNGLKATYKKLITDVMDNRAKEYKDKGNPTYIAKEMVLAEEVSLSLRAAYFDMNPEEVGIFNTMVATFATEAPINSIAMAEANRLYTQAIDKLTPEMFMKDITDDQERYVANAKYDAILGKTFDKEDDYKRSTLLPAFLALSMVSKDFRDVISKIEAPLAKKSDAEGLNGAIENLGYKMITELGERLVGTNKATNVQQSVDILGEVIAREADKHESLVELGLNKAGGLTDKLNDYIVESAGVLSDRLLPNRTAEEKASQSKGAKLVDGLRMGVAAAISEKNGKIVSEGVSDYLDKTEISEWMRNLMSDMFGRTEGNKDIWDMVKQFRSRIQVIRQGYRDDLPDVIRSMFSRELTKEEDGSVYRSMGKTELASLVMNGMSADEAINLASDSRARKDKINQIKSQLGNIESGSVVTKIDSKAKQLATFMNTKVAGNDLARNARTILLTSVGGNKLASAVDKSGNYEDSYNSLYGKTEALIDSLVTLYAVDDLSKNDLDTFKELSSTEKDGIAFTFSYLVGQVREERQSDSVAVKANSYKGYMPFEMKEDVSLRVDDDLNYDTLSEQGYVRLDAFTGSNIMPQRGMSYFYMPASAKAAFKQGIVQNVKQTKGGVDPVTGFSTGAIVKRYSNRSDIATIQRRIGRQKSDTPLLPVYDGYGVVVGYEQGISPEMAKRTTADEELMPSIGKWRGRQVEEYLAKISNEELVGKLKNTYEKDIEASPENAKKYVDLFKSTDPVIVDSVRLIPFETRKSIMAAFDGRFMVQRGMVKEVVGYRNASVGDFWTGNSRYSPELQNTAKRILVSIFGKDAYVKLMKGEQFIENVVNSAKDLIVTKSVIVPAINILSNILHAVSRGTPFRDIAKGYAKYTKEINTYLTSRQEYIIAEAKLRAATDRNEITKLNAILKSIDDSHRRMDIWPLIEAGEFTAVSSADSRYADVKLASGKITEYIEGAASKLPDGLNTAGKYLLVTKETALYNALQKSVEYGDFIAKAVYYEDLTKRLGVSKKEALGRVSEEYISYDHLPGRARGKLENLGLLWFYNFKLRSSKIALSTMRNNPVHTLLALNIPSPDMFGSTGIPVQDNVFTKLAEGSLGYSIGIGQGLNSIGLNPWYNLTR